MRKVDRNRERGIEKAEREGREHDYRMGYKNTKTHQ